MAKTSAEMQRDYRQRQAAAQAEISQDRDHYKHVAELLAEENADLRQQLAAGGAGWCRTHHSTYQCVRCVSQHHQLAASLNHPQPRSFLP